MPLILGTNSIKDTGYDVDNSCRFDSASSTEMTKAGATPTSNTTATFSCWFKTGLATDPYLWTSRADGNNRCLVTLAGNTLYAAAKQSGSYVFQLRTNRVLRDPSAWYHVCVAFDTTQGTAANRVKMYINGVQETSFQTSDYPSENATLELENAFYLGSTNGGDFFSGYLAEVVLVDGQQLDPTSFGEFDEDSGIWKPIDVSGLTFGTNGFYLDFENSGSLGADVSGNGNNFTVNNLTSADQTPDTPTNNFATLNPLGFAGTIPTFSQGNLNVSVGSSASLYSVSTIGVSSGKWYVEGELEQAAISGGSYYVDYGFHDRTDSLGQSYYVSDGRMFWLSSWDGKINYRTGGTDTIGLVTGLATLTPGDFFQLYLDMDNELMYWGKNGSLLNTTGVSFNGKESLTGEYFFAVGDQYTAATHEWAVNFGQGSIDGNAVSNFQDANGFGNFKYNPTVTTDEGSKDFLALCTKNLAEYG
jgi:hypothetical protein